MLGSGPSLSLDDPTSPPRPHSASSRSDSTAGAGTAPITLAPPIYTPSSDTTPRARIRSVRSVESGLDRLTVVSERTEPESASSRNATPTASNARTFGAVSPVPPDSLRPGFTLPTAARYPLPASPIKSALSSSGPQTSPTKASALIRLFENKTGPQAPPPPIFSKTASNWISQPLRSTEPTQPLATQPPPTQPPPSSYRAAPSEAPSQSTGSYATAIPQSPPSKPPSPLASVRTLIASWKARSGSPSQRVVGSPGRGSLLSRDGWNVSIRRRRRHEGQEEVLAEQGEDTSHLHPLPTLSETVDAAVAEEEALLNPPPRSASVRSSRSHGSSSVAPKVFGGEVS
jgi:hypothetical protein